MLCLHPIVIFQTSFRSDGDSDDYSEESSESDGHDETVSSGKGMIDLTLERLESMHAVATSRREDMSEAAEHGQSAERVRDVVNRPRCGCKCRVPFQLLLRICVCFWCLTKSAQDTILWSLQQGEEKKKDWHM